MTWLQAVDPDVLMLQETKAQPEQIDVEAFEKLGYNVFIHSAEKKGYSGVAIFSKVQPDQVQTGCGIDKYDSEGRILRADFGDITLLSTYFPSGSSGEHRQAFKMDFLKDFTTFTENLLKARRKVVISGDYNICHKPIDIHNPVSNKNSSGFLPEERAWLTDFMDLGFMDSFRHFHPEAHRYSWWSFRANARAKNLGWRIDYHMVSEGLRAQLEDADIHEEVKHSDHCPISLTLSI
jgi:exodeoxyribonuclease-3